jgi:hypothetical protein
LSEIKKDTEEEKNKERNKGKTNERIGIEGRRKNTGGRDEK